jgi:hypothetical protein
MSDVTSFYSNDFAVKLLCSMDDDWLEGTHDFIQVIFPNKEASKFVPDAKLLTDEDIHQFRSNNKLRSNLIKVIGRMFLFWEIGKDKPVWISKHNHNYLRITRTIIFLKAVGFADCNFILYDYLQEMFNLYPDEIGDTTFAYWKTAMFGKEI